MVNATKKILKRLMPRWLVIFIAGLQRRRSGHVTFVGITGSVGKTMTKDLTAAILAAFGPCQKTAGSYNTFPSIAGRVWNTGRAHRYCVAEIGASGPGTMDQAVRILKPDIGVITVIGRDHFAAYKSMEALAGEKAKLVLALPAHGTAVLNMDDPLIRSIGERCRCRIIWFGAGEGAHLRLLEARSLWPQPLRVVFEYQHGTHEIQTQLHGTHMAIPVLASLGVALAAGLSLEASILAVTRVQPPDGRMQMVTAADGVVFIRDDFKAPHWSMAAPLEFLRNARAKRKIAVIGTFSDSSGDYGPKYRDIAASLRTFADRIVFIGPHARRGLKGNQDQGEDPVVGFRNIRNAADFLLAELRPGDLVLVKGTNEQDHLLRLILSRSRPVRCWEEQCGRQLFCDQCPKLYASGPDADIGPVEKTPPGTKCLVVVGLGNPGYRFRRTPHNVGYRVLDLLVRSAGGVWMPQPEGRVCALEMDGAAVHLLKPGSKMNGSGEMVRRFLARLGCDPENCLIVHDDMNFSFGQVRFKPRGGDAGHKGMRSILSAFDTEDMPRVRLGVGMPADDRQARQFVLTKFSAKDEARLIPVIEQAAARVREYVRSRPK